MACSGSHSGVGVGQSLELACGSHCLLGHGAPGLVGPPPGAVRVSGSSSCPDPHLGCLFTQPHSSDPRPGGLTLACDPVVVNTQLQAPVAEARSPLSCALPCTLGSLGRNSCSFSCNLGGVCSQ